LRGGGHKKIEYGIDKFKKLEQKWLESINESKIQKKMVHRCPYNPAEGYIL
jgi:hypothetical protein